MKDNKMKKIERLLNEYGQEYNINVLHDLFKLSLKRKKHITYVLGSTIKKGSITTVLKPDIHDIRYHYRQFINVCYDYINRSDYNLLCDILNHLYYVNEKDNFNNDIITIVRDLTDKNISYNKPIKKVINALYEHYINDIKKTTDVPISTLRRYQAESMDTFKDKKVVLNFKVSTNPLDFMLMSHGNSWNSCHRIGGQYQGGQISYMTDSTSLLIYGENEYLDKTFRVLAYYNKDTSLMFSRTYGYIDDRILDDIKKEVTKLFLGDDYKPYNADYRRFYGDAVGSAHYADYKHIPPILYVKSDVDIEDIDNLNRSLIGSKQRCICCGEIFENDESLNCSNCNGLECAYCGGYIEPDELTIIDGEPYCCDCVAYCDDCDEYHITDNMEYLENYDRWVCRDCLEDYYSCAGCGQIIHIDDLQEVPNLEYGNMLYCDDCLHY